VLPSFDRIQLLDGSGISRRLLTAIPFMSEVMSISVSNPSLPFTLRRFLREPTLSGTPVFSPLPLHHLLSGFLL